MPSTLLAGWLAGWLVNWKLEKPLGIQCDSKLFTWPVATLGSSSGMRWATQIVGTLDEGSLSSRGRSTFAVDGKDCKVNKEVERVLKEFHGAKKPIG